MTRLVPIALAMLALVGGCSLIVDDTPRVTNRCSVDAECATGTHCDPSGMCVSPPNLPYDLWLEVAPPSDGTGGTSTPVDLGPYTAFSGPISLVVSRPVAVRGTVRRDGVPVTAQLTFTPVPSTTTALALRSISTRTTASTGDVDFATALPSRGDYDVQVDPLGEFRATVPPFHGRLTVGAMDTALQVVLPTDETMVEGQLVDRAGAPIPDFDVLAVDRATGVQVSSVATTSADTAGHFGIALRGTSSPFDLVVRPNAARASTVPSPTFRVQPEVLLPDAMGHVTILLPTGLMPVHWAGTVETPEERGAMPVPLAVVQLHSDDVVDAATGVVGSLDVTVTTDELGVYDTMVLPGTYAISIAASSNDTLGVLREVRDLRPAAGVSEILGHVFHLPLRTVLAGTVQSPDGDLVRDAQVRATPLGIPLTGLTDPEVARYARPAMALSGPMGDFRLDLDVGVYDVVVEPPEGSGFPWTVVLDYGIGGSTQTLADVMQVDPPVVVDNAVTWQDGAVLAGAEVRAFAITSEGRPVMVGRGTSDAEGDVRILVPAMLGSHDPTMMARLRP